MQQMYISGLRCMQQIKKYLDKEEPDNEECFSFWHQYKSTFGLRQAISTGTEGIERAGIQFSSRETLQSWRDYHEAT